MELRRSPDRALGRRNSHRWARRRSRRLHITILSVGYMVGRGLA
ncbi:MAG: hypothetical protein AVDCRST_MAG17-520 [uncultured Solirubrobacterales bacterium]|uniref:Uncharacterized protein n=1 Tax=uncultured Solirubrobacterales bacterium TaxID=768556 RepID=A0A6J4S991_9ACTN|nr:MAG: hypothetical protein AVDCRST_MAG17-520 [uncultured Solirubrobacterales bacterium]